MNFGQNAGIHHNYSKRTDQRTLYRDRILERKSLTGIKRHKDQRILDLIKIKLFVIGSTVSLWGFWSFIAFALVYRVSDVFQIGKTLKFFQTGLKLINVVQIS